jgi:hypothetical protein
MPDGELPPDETENTPPTVNAGADISDATVYTIVDLAATASDADGDTLTYTWTFLSAPAGSNLFNSDITGRYQLEASFAPDATGDFIMKFSATDGPSAANDTVTVSVTDTPFNNTPEAYLYADEYIVLTDTLVTFTGCGTDINAGDTLTYIWAIDI